MLIALYEDCPSACFSKFDLRLARGTAHDRRHVSMRLTLSAVAVPVFTGTKATLIDLIGSYSLVFIVILHSGEADSDVEELQRWQKTVRLSKM